jgi:ABC-2 type transport system ATP-binding protein
MIELQGLQKVVDHDLRLDVEALTVRAGDVVALVGPVGSGRSELLELLTGRSRPTAGTLRVAGIEPRAQRREFSRRAGVLFAEDALYPRQSALGNLLFHCRLRGLSRARAEEVLAQVGLGDHAGVRAERLPSGLARRLAFGCAILHAPQALILVDPFARCDEASIALLGKLARQRADDGAAVLMLAEGAAGLEGLCDTLYTLERGRLAANQQPASERRAELPFKIPVRLEDKVALVNPAEILYVEAEESRAILHTAAGRLPTQFTVSELEQRLARSGFFRAHRGYLVNLQHVKEVIPYTRNSFTLVLDDAEGSEIPLSKSAAGELRALLGY